MEVGGVCERCHGQPFTGLHLHQGWATAVIYCAASKLAGDILCYAEHAYRARVTALGVGFTLAPDRDITCGRVLSRRATTDKSSNELAFAKLAGMVGLGLALLHNCALGLTLRLRSETTGCNILR